MSRGRTRAREPEHRPRQERHLPLKRFGQHFLTDPNILQRIISAADITPSDIVLEIGPGLGSLTSALLEAGARVVAVEIDRELVQRISEEGGGNVQLTLLEGDFLTATPEEWLARAGLDTKTPYKVAANLPYYITSAILRQLLEAERQPEAIVVMVQREVAQQITARPGEMSVLSVSVQFYGTPQIVGQVPAGAFRPAPKVDSTILRILVQHPSRFPDVDPARFFQLVRAGFSERRKQLRNSLSHGLHLAPGEVDARLARVGIDPRRRAETLELGEWRRIYAQFPPHGGHSSHS